MRESYREQGGQAGRGSDRGGYDPRQFGQSTYGEQGQPQGSELSSFSGQATNRGQSAGRSQGEGGSGQQRPLPYDERSFGQSTYGLQGMSEQQWLQIAYGPSGRPGQADRTIWQGPHTGKGPKGYQRSDDRIREDVCEQLTRHGDVDASDIDVEVSQGEVTLNGSVADRQQKRLAEDAAEQVRGVKDVHNRLRIGQQQLLQVRAAGDLSGQFSNEHTPSR